MLPFIKVFSLVVRAFSRPLVNYTKRYHSNNKHNVHKLIRIFFIRLGNYYNRIETKINKKFLKIELADDVFIKPLSDDVALDKGVEFFYEIFFYGIIISLPLLEIWDQQQSNKKKADDLNNKLTYLDNEIKVLHTKELENNKNLNMKIEGLESLIANTEKNTAEVMNEMSKLKYDINKLIELQMRNITNVTPATQ